ncbi:MAG: thiolase family protein [Anaerolineae bacterium]|nr:acetyl-CoA C-acyltransferase [Anaerolineales bacterium]MCQ3979043.1 3-oxoadipyl-CoA thiolase [Anaerolineae bacterium]
MSQAVIIDAVRTPVGAFAGALSQVRPDDLAALVLKALVERVGLDPALAEEVILGCTNQAGEDNRNVARMALLLAGFPHHVGGVTVNRLCASGLDAIIAAHRAIASGEGDIYIAGGVESMTRAPYVLSKSESAFDRGAKIFDTSIGWRFPNPKMEAMFPLEAMGETAENIYEQRLDLSRERQDAFALESQRRAVDAINAGRFMDEIVPVPVPQRKGEPVLVSVDEYPRMKWVSEEAGRREGEEVKRQGRYELSTSMEILAKLKPAFRAGGTVTAGNSSGINDGAAAVLLMSAERAEALGLKPLARIVAAASAGVDPRLMGLGPIPATRKALDRAGLSVTDLDLIELNEAFAVQALAVMDELGLPPERTNVNGGAIALGHPLGCSGARIMTTLVHEMKRRQREGRATSPYGLATMCVGVGQGVSVIVEWVGG